MNALMEIKAPSAPKALGPYSQAIRAGNFVFCSGQIGIDSQTDTMAGENIRTQTRQAIENVRLILESAGLGLESVVKTEVYLKHIGDFSEMNEAYADAFTTNPKPARTTFEVANLPKNALVEITCTAYTV